MNPLFNANGEQIPARPSWRTTFVGESWTEVATQARKIGWRISKDRTRCFAPKHKIRRFSD